MTTIVIHAGMPKAGSSSIQLWLRENWKALREHGLTLVIPTHGRGNELKFVPYEEGDVNSGWIISQLEGLSQVNREAVAAGFVDAFATAAERFGDIILTGEAIANPFWELDATALTALQGLSLHYAVTTAYYVRPQHAALESAWRQTGFHSPLPPSLCIRNRGDRLQYAATRRGVERLAPDLNFELRPFHEDWLDHGDIVRDFTDRFLGIESSGGIWENRGLPLEIAILLRVAPTGMFVDRSYGYKRLDKVKRVLEGLNLPENGHIALSRRVLQRYAYERFGGENAELGWGDFVPPVDSLDGIPDIEALDELWQPKASSAERVILFRALQVAIED